MRVLQLGTMPFPQQAQTLPMQAGYVPATTAQQFDMTTIMNMMIMVMFMVMMMKMMGKATEGFK